ncbi:MAG: polysaccharide biosynthesis C-terminal domain-containing protein, partial [Thermoleophilia bacterium]|nr:polysaccharide biosynthesis C-terminal domain-containing protein [Thermoleophilia bacterium]
LLRRMFRFGLPTMPAEISIYSLAFIDRVIISHSLGAAQLGLYGLAFKFSQAIQVVVRGFQLAWPPLAYSIRDDEDARRTYAVVVTAFAALCGTIVVGMWLEARWIVRLLAAPDFFDSYEAIGPLALGAALYGIYLALVVILGRTGKTQYNFPVTAAATIANVVLNLLLVPAWGIVGAGVALTVSYLIVIVLIHAVSRRIFPIPWQWGRLAVIAAAAAGLIAAGEALLPDAGAAGFLSRLALAALYPAILWFGGAVRAAERRQVLELLGPERLRARWAVLRERRAGESDEEARAETLYEQEVRDQRD